MTWLLVGICSPTHGWQVHRARENLGGPWIVQPGRIGKGILTGFLGIKNPAVLHVLQRQTYGIRKFGVCVITGHCIMHVPFIVALADHLVLPLAKFLIQEVGIFVLLNFPLLLEVLAVQVGQ